MSDAADARRPYAVDLIRAKAQEQLELDARRYRWWREGEMRCDTWREVAILSGEQLDEAIDAILEDEEGWIEGQLGPRERDYGFADSPIRNTAAGLNAQRYKPGADE